MLERIAYFWKLIYFLIVFQVNASECRSGALVKQRFGEALKSRQLKRFFEYVHIHVLIVSRSYSNASLR